MRIFNEDKTKELDYKNIYLKKGKLIDDKLVTHIEQQDFIEEQGHYETIKEYANGGKDVEWVVDVKGQEYKPAHDEEEQILVYIPYTEEELEKIWLEDIRFKREQECFSVINRGELWYKHLTNEQKEELEAWYISWLNVTDTKVVPEKPKWI